MITFGWWELVNLSINVIANTNLDSLAVIKAIENGDSEVCHPVDHNSIADEDGVEPTTATRTSRGGAKLQATGMEEFGDFVILRRERA